MIFLFTLLVYYVFTISCYIKSKHQIETISFLSNEIFHMRKSLNNVWGVCNVLIKLERSGQMTSTEFICEGKVKCGYILFKKPFTMKIQ